MSEWTNLLLTTKGNFPSFNSNLVEFIRINSDAKGFARQLHAVKENHKKKRASCEGPSWYFRWFRFGRPWNAKKPKKAKILENHLIFYCCNFLPFCFALRWVKPWLKSLVHTQRRETSTSGFSVFYKCLQSRFNLQIVCWTFKYNGEDVCYFNLCAVDYSFWKKRFFRKRYISWFERPQVFGNLHK